MQISVDRMTPSTVTKKSFKTVLPKLDYFKDSKINLHITGVICKDTLPESRAVLETGLSHGIPTEVRLVHADPTNRFRVEQGPREEAEAFIEEMIERKRAGEKMWRLPLDDEYRDMIKSGIADIVNSGGRYGGAVTAAMFLKEFVEDKPWIHLDIAGTAWVDEAKPFIAKGPSGIAVRSLIEFVRGFAA